VQAAEALLEAFGWKPTDETTENELVRAYAGALLVYAGIQNLIAIRKMLTPSK
jgi:hypothetical protein